MEGDIDAIDGVMRITKIRVAYNLKCSEDQMDAGNRAYKHHPLMLLLLLNKQVFQLIQSQHLDPISLTLDLSLIHI